MRREAFSSEKLESQLEDAALQFLTDKTKNRFNSEKQTLELSKIFEWYGGDFVKKFGSLEQFLANRITSNPAEQELIRNKKTKISFPIDYDWSLNE